MGTSQEYVLVLSIAFATVMCFCARRDSIRLDTLSPEVFPRLNQRLVREWHIVHKQPNEVVHDLSIVGEKELILNIVKATSQKSIAGTLTGWFEWVGEKTLVISFYLYHRFSHNNIPNRKRIKFGLRVSSAFSYKNNQ